MSLDSDTLKQLADEVLTFIEQREAEQVAYGVYDVTMTGAEIIDDFQPSEDIQLAVQEKAGVIISALQQLADDLQIICFNKAESPTDWVFRSRIAEIVRLKSKTAPTDC